MFERFWLKLVLWSVFLDSLFWFSLVDVNGEKGGGGGLEGE